MKIVIKKDNTTLLHAAFMFLLFSEIAFQNSTISRIALILFVGLSVVVTRRFFWTAHLTGYCLFLAWSVLGVILGYAISNKTAFAMARTLMLNILFLYAFVCYCRYIGDIHSIFRKFFWVTLVFCVILLIGGMSLVLQGRRLSVMGINANRIAKLLSYTIIMAVYEWISKPKRERKRQELLVILMMAIAIVLTGSRKGLIIPVLGLYILFGFMRPGKWVRNTALVVVASMLLITLLMNVEPLYRIIGRRIEIVLQFLQGEEIGTGSLSMRLNLIEIGWEETKKQPIWGHGLGCYATLRSTGTYSHCNFIEVLFSSGWVGAIFYYAPFVYCYVNMIKYRNVARSQVGVMAALLIPFVVCDYMNVTYFDRLSLLIPAMAMATISKRGLLDENKKIT